MFVILKNFRDNFIFKFGKKNPFFGFSVKFISFFLLFFPDSDKNIWLFFNSPNNSQFLQRLRPANRRPNSRTGSRMASMASWNSQVTCAFFWLWWACLSLQKCGCYVLESVLWQIPAVRSRDCHQQDETAGESVEAMENLKKSLKTRKIQ